MFVYKLFLWTRVQFSRVNYWGPVTFCGNNEPTHDFAFYLFLIFFFRSLLPGGKPVCVLSPGEQLPLKFPDRCKTNVINAAMFLSDPPTPAPSARQGVLRVPAHAWPPAATPIPIPALKEGGFVLWE